MNAVCLLMARSSIIILFLLSSFTPLHCQDSVNLSEQKNEWISDFYEENEKCFRCHEAGVLPSEGFTEDTIDYLKKHGMLINREEFHASNHGAFACNQCHFDDGTDLRILAREGKFTCLNCHGFDPESDPYPFLRIAEEYDSSVHTMNKKIGFSCWKCHDPHTYRSAPDSGSTPGETIVYHNSICLDCHSRLMYQPVLEKGDSTKVLSHDWLPNRSLHFSVIRCNKCHSPMVNDTLMPHLILPAIQADKRCVDCHTKDPRLLATLYKFHAKEQRSQTGMFSGMLFEELSIVGTKGNSNLNSVSIVLFMLTILCILLHIYFRIRISTKKKT